jgi:type II secretory pathway pseudopilin PulG
MKVRKRPFLLLEVLISISIVSMAILPILSWQSHSLLMEKQLTRSERAAHMAGSAYAQLLEDLYLGRIAFLDIPELSKGSLPLDLEVPALEKLGYFAHARLSKQKNPRSSNYLLHIELSLIPIDERLAPLIFTFNHSAQRTQPDRRGPR